MFHHFCFQWCKNFPKKLKIAKFLGFFSLFYHFIFIFLSVFIIFAASGVKIFKKMENCNFTRVFFFIVLSFFYLCLSCFYHVSSFLPPVVQKFSKKLKVAIFLEFFSFFLTCFIMFLSCFIIFASSGAKKIQKNGKLQFSSSFFHCFIILFIIFYQFSSFLLPVV